MIFTVAIAVLVIFVTILAFPERVLPSPICSINFHDMHKSLRLRTLYNIINLRYKVRSFVLAEKDAARVVQLFVYPIKSVGHLEVESWQVDEHGFKYDRQYAIGYYDADKKQYKVITQRECPKLAATQIKYIAATLESSQDWFKISYMDDYSKLFHLPAKITDDFIRKNSQSSDKDTSLWNNLFKTVVFEQDMLPNEFLVWSGMEQKYSNEIVSEIRLLYSESGKPVKVASPKELQKPRSSLFHDYYPFHIIAQQDVNFVNCKLNSPVTALNFRGNIVVSTNSIHAFDIDTWQRFSICSDTEKHVLKTATKCIRCSIPNINILGIMDSKMAVLKILNRYRKIDAGTAYPAFGINAIHCDSGYIISVGDSIEISERKVNTFEPIS